MASQYGKMDWGVAQDPEHEDESDEDAELLELLGNGRTTASKPVILAKLFGGQDKHPSWPFPAEVNAESELMQALAEVDEDKCPHDGAVEILSEDKYIEWGSQEVRGDLSKLQIL